MKQFIGIVLLFVVAVAACSTDKKHRQMDGTLRLYEKSIRWGDYDGAQTVQKESRALIDSKILREFKVTSYNVIQQEIRDDFTRLNQTVEIRFYHEQQGKEIKLIDEQTWLYDNELETWLLDSGLPDFNSAIQ